MFIDGAHTYEYVKIDTDNALNLVNYNGYIVWHDYLSLILIMELCIIYMNSTDRCLYIDSVIPYLR